MTQPLTREQRKIWRRIVLASYGFTDDEKQRKGDAPTRTPELELPTHNEPRTPVLGRSGRRGSQRKPE